LQKEREISPGDRRARIIKTRHKAVILRISFQEWFLRIVSSSSSGSACGCEWNLEIGGFREWMYFPVALDELLLDLS
jgi:hypothetical protein